MSDEDNEQQGCDSGLEVENIQSDEELRGQKSGCDENVENLLIDDEGPLEDVKKPNSFTVSHVNMLLKQLEGKLLSYKMFARDTKPSRNT